MIFFSSVPWVITNWTFSYRESGRRELPSYLNSEKNLQSLSRVYVPILNKSFPTTVFALSFFLPVKCVYTSDNFVIVNQLFINSWMIWRILGFRQSRYNSPRSIVRFFLIFVWLPIINVKKFNSYWHVTMIALILTQVKGIMKKEVGELFS